MTLMIRFTTRITFCFAIPQQDYRTIAGWFRTCNVVDHGATISELFNTSHILYVMPYDVLMCCVESETVAVHRPTDFITETEPVNCAIRNEYLNRIKVNCSL
jgi:hypothetical protein